MQIEWIVDLKVMKEKREKRTMKKNTESKDSLFKKARGEIFIVEIIAILLLVTVISIFIQGYTSAQEKSEQRIAELEAEVERLSVPVAIYEDASKEININVINAEIQDIGELVTIEYLYTDAGKFSDAKQLWGVDVPFTTKSFIAKWDGTIKAGVKVEQIIVEVNEVTKEIIVHIPKVSDGTLWEAQTAL